MRNKSFLYTFSSSFITGMIFRGIAPYNPAAETDFEFGFLYGCASAELDVLDVANNYMMHDTFHETTLSTGIVCSTNCVTPHPYVPTKRDLLGMVR